MPITSHAAPTVIFDCIRLAPSETGIAPVEQLVNWVRSYPTSSTLHVHLRNALRVHGGRRLQSTLQALGCTVTMETSFLPVLS